MAMAISIVFVVVIIAVSSCLLLLSYGYLEKLISRDGAEIFVAGKEEKQGIFWNSPLFC